MPHLVLASAAISGTAYLQQFAIARLVSPNEFGVVRSVESIIVVLVWLGSCGMPSLAIRLIADEQPEARGALLRRLLTIVVASCAIVVTLALTASFAIGDATIAGALRALVTVTFLTSAARVLFNYHNGVMEVRAAAIVAVVLAGLSFFILVASVSAYGMRGWIPGRLLGELVLVSGLLWLVRDVIGSRAKPSRFKAREILKFGAALGFSLFFRGMLDSATILLLGVFDAPAHERGFYGLATLLLTATMLVPVSLGSLLLPRMVARQGRADEYLRTGVAWAVAFTVGVVALTIAALPWALRLAFPAYVGGAGIATALLFAAPSRAVIMIAGSRLIAASAVAPTIVLNAAGVALLVAGVSLAYGRWGVIGAVWATVSVELALAISTYALASRLAKDPQLSSFN